MRYNAAAKGGIEGQKLFSAKENLHCHRPREKPDTRDGGSVMLKAKERCFSKSDLHRHTVATANADPRAQWEKHDVA